MAEAAMGFLGHQFEASGGIDLSSRQQNIVCPQHDASVADRPGMVDALINESSAKSESAGRRINQQDPQLCGVSGPLTTEDASRRNSVHFCDPGVFAARLEVGVVVGNDRGDQLLEFRVPRELFPVHRAVAMHDPIVVRCPELSNVDHRCADDPDRSAGLSLPSARDQLDTVAA